MPESYPNDVDGDSLRRIASSGSDMSKSMDIDFHIAAPDKLAAKQVAACALKLGYRISIYADNDENQGDEGNEYPWTCQCTKTMLATYDSVIAVQSELDGIAQPHGAYADGWGTFGNSDGAG